MGISGNLEDVSVADVLQFVHLGRRSGRLSLARDEETAVIQFEQGRLVAARSSAALELGEVLLSEGLVEGADLAAVEQDDPGTTAADLAAALLQHGILDQESLQQARRRQMEAAVAGVLEWRRGTFEFHVEEAAGASGREAAKDAPDLPVETVSDLDIETQLMLIRAARKKRDTTPTEEAEGDQTHPVLKPVEDPDDEADDSLNDDTEPALGPPSGPDDTTVGFAPPYRTQMLPMQDLGAALEGASPLLAEPVEEADEALEAVAAARVRYSPGASGGSRVRIVTADEDLFERLTAALPPAIDLIERSELAQVAALRPGETPPVVVADLRDAKTGLAEISELTRLHPEVAVVVVLDEARPPRDAASAFAAGALAVAPPDVEALMACLLNVLEFRRAVAGASSTASALEKKLEQLRRSTRELRTGYASATVALQLLQLLADSVDRALLFLRRDGRLRCLGAFGDALDADGRTGEPLAALSRALELRVDEYLSEVVAAGEAQVVDFASADLPAELRNLLGAPRTGQAMLLPVHGAEDWISLIYADNGALEEPFEDLVLLELAAAQIGVALENEQLRRQRA